MVFSSATFYRVILTSNVLSTSIFLFPILYCHFFHFIFRQYACYICFANISLFLLTFPNLPKRILCHILLPLWQIDTWAELFKAKTWEDIRMITQTNHTLTNAAESLFQYNSDDIIRQHCRAREDYERHERTVNKKIQDLTQALEESENARIQTEQSYQQRIAKLEVQLQAHGIQP